MNIQIKIGSMEYLNDCEEALHNSELGKQYFEKEGSAEKAVLEGINSGNLYVALENDQCIGFIYYLPDGAFHSFVCLHLIAVKHEHRGKGVGKIMLKYVEEIAFKANDKIFLVVSDFNPSGKIFYEKLGYKQVGLIPSLYREGINEYLMMKAYNQKA
ncbi:MAG: GNAT family N-acetyltransferase [Clostridiales bacterium]|nr:GNAT family N-acetyltransferase [Clostridiales bacterium]